MTYRLPLAFAAPAILLAGCAATDEGYPSLAPRAVETASFAEPLAPPPVSVAADPALDARIAQAVRARDAAVRDFDAAAAAARTRARAARGAAAGSESWIAAQTALAELDALRARHQDAAGALEDMAAARAQALQPAYPALEQAIAQARATGTDQTRQIDALAAQLRPA
jgi:hypothetical protein